MYRLVVIDDEYIVVEGIKAMIARKRMNYEVVGCAYDGIHALEVIQETKPDLVITDIRIPGLDGLSMIEQAKELCEDTAFIVISGYMEFEYARKALQLGVMGYIDKPISIDKLNEALERVEKEYFQAREEVRQYAESVLSVLGKYIEADKTKKGHGTILELLSYIEAHYNEDIGLNELADMVKMNTTYLSVLFKSEVGMSYVKYLTKIRVDKAKELLREGYKVYEVSEWRSLYQKPIVVDECAYEGNIDFGWGNISGEEMTRRFWKGCEFEIELIDTWNMTVKKLPGVYRGSIRAELPEKQYMAIRMKRLK